MNIQKIRKIALERIYILFELAIKEFKKHPERSHRYAYLIRKIGMKCNVKIPKHIKMWICKKCNKFLMPGANCRVRLVKKPYPMVLITCLECGNKKRYPYIKEIKMRRRKMH